MFFHVGVPLLDAASLAGSSVPGADVQPPSPPLVFVLSLSTGEKGHFISCFFQILRLGLQASRPVRTWVF